MNSTDGGPAVVVDGLAFEVQAVGGISQIFRECLPLICELGAQITVGTAGGLEQPIPSHPRLTHLRLGSYGRLARPEGRAIPLAAPFRGALFASRLRGRSRSIWQSTYFTLPPPRWSGPNVILVPDLIYELFPDLLSSPGDARFREQRRRYITAADIVICISEATKRDLLGTFDVHEATVHVVHLAATDAYRRDPRSERHRPGRPFFLYVGGRASYKNFRVVVDAWTIWRKRAEVDLVVAGPPFSEQEERLIADEGLIQMIRHSGRPTEPELAQLYGTAAGFIYPSRYEGFGIPLVEAMGCGCPVIASDIPSSREVAQDCAIYFDPSSAEALVTALDQVLATGADTTVACGLRRAREFSWHRTARLMYEIYAGL